MENIKNKKEMDLTSGNLFLKMPLFALPMAFTTILQLLYSTVDLFTVSNFGGGSNSMSAVGSNSALINLIIVFFVSFSMGSNVLMANAKGADDKERANRILHSSLILAFLTGVLVGVIGYFISPFLLKMMNTPDSIITNATTYLKIYFIGLPFLMIYNYGSQILRALGDSKRPFYILVISGLINVIFDLIFVICFKLDVAGVAYATIFSEFVSALLIVLWLIFYKKGYVYLKFRDLKLDKQSLIGIVKIGFPSGIQGLGYYIPGVLIQSSLYALTSAVVFNTQVSVEEIVAGNAACSTVESYVYAFVEAFATASTSFVSQNYGANKKENIKKILWYSLFWSEVFCVICALLCFLLSDPILKIFITDGEGINTSNALLVGKERMYLLVFTYGIDAIMDVSSFYLRGLNHSTSPSVVTICTCIGIRLFFIYVLFPIETYHTLMWLLIIYPISWAIASLILLPMCIIIQNKEVNRMSKLEEITIKTV